MTRIVVSGLFVVGLTAMAVSAQQKCCSTYNRPLYGQ
jgi:hypothetical protein